MTDEKQADDFNDLYYLGDITDVCGGAEGRSKVKVVSKWKKFRS